MRINRLPGKIELKIEGNQIEKLLTHALSKGIIFRNINRLAYNSISVSIKQSQFNQVKAICKENKFSLTVLKKKGIASVIKRLQHKRGFFIGFIVCVLAVVYMNMHIWEIDITGVTQEKEEQIKNYLLNKEIKRGSSKSDIDFCAVERDILETNKEISWVSVSYNGTVLRVELSEATLEPKIVDLSKPCNIVSNKNAVITNINVFRGEARIHENQQVFIDDLLVSGTLKHEKHETVEFVHAQARIQARVWYEKRYYYKYDDFVTNKTGNISEGWHLHWNEKEIDLDKNMGMTTYYEVEKKNYKLPLFKDIELKKIEKIEIEDLSHNMSKEEIINKASEKAFNQAVKELNVEGKVIDKKYRCDIIEGDSITVSIYLETMEEIGVERSIEAVGGS